jgi:16S rRNA (guanine(527)-N(7))-methyltransferase RsmG
LASKGYGLTGEQLDSLVAFHRILMDRNRTLNLTRIYNLEDIVSKHYIDCFIVDRLVKLPSPLLDLGTGGGFPGIPLRILRPDLHLILADGVMKRIHFLRMVRRELGFERLDLIGRNIDREFFYPVNGVITRAVELIPVTLDRIKNCLMKNGLAIFMKGPNADDEIKEAMTSHGDEYRLEADKGYTLPGTKYKRRLVVFRRLNANIEDPERVLEETEEGA